MAKIEFKDNSFIEFVNSKKGVTIVMGARDSDDKLKFRINSVELDLEQFKQATEDLKLQTD
jgi:hypothetical protein